MTSSIAAIHVAKKQLGLDDDTYRAKLINITGIASVKDMNEDQRQKVLTVFRSEGFKPKADRRPDGRQKLSGRYAAKLQALWIAGWNLCVFKNRDDVALETFVKRQTGLDAVRFCHDPEDARKAIEALKAILAREGGVDWTVYQAQPLHYRHEGFRVARAQWKILNPTDPAGFWPAVTSLAGGQVPASDRSWIVVMNELGNRIRAAKKAGA